MIAAVDFHEGAMHKMMAQLRSGVSQEQVLAEGVEAVGQWLRQQMRVLGMPEGKGDSFLDALLKMDVDLNAAGLLAAAQRTMSQGSQL
eukprot:NODE_4044_length_703_cov_71.103976_g3419_i0.p4 GENE.NODE_4044_length_703_cov_71.103976_g3419_i0~~NODE_4044_length_703_cov_71.103976_g3419_i0.p4  ORF type:complete len:88 (-),score=35.56 NODE_4044_length_703_cov_71.103976_g3419_i0:129-392(-)